MEPRIKRIIKIKRVSSELEGELERHLHDLLLHHCKPMTVLPLHLTKLGHSAAGDDDVPRTQRGFLVKVFGYSKGTDVGEGARVGSICKTDISSGLGSSHGRFSRKESEWLFEEKFLGVHCELMIVECCDKHLCD